MKEHLVKEQYATTRFFDFLLDNSKLASILIMDTKGKILQTNDGFKRALGYSPEDIIGKNVEVLFTKEDIKLKKHEIEIQTTLRQGYASDDNYIVHKRGNPTWVTGEAILVKDEGTDYIIKIIFDIDRQKQLEVFLKTAHEKLESRTKELLANEERLSLAIESSEMGIWVFHPLTGKLEWSDKCRELFNMPKSIDVDYEIFLHQLHIDDRAAVNAKLMECLNPENECTYDVEYRVINDHGEVERWLSDKGKVIFDINTNPIRVVGTVRDITEMVQLEEVIEKANENMNEFMSFTSHELRTPITSLKAYIQLLERKFKEKKDKEVEDYLKKAHVLVENINALVSELHEVAKIQAGKLQLNKTEFNFEACLNNMIETIQVTNKAHKIIKKGKVDVLIFADKQRVEQVILNYLTNAIKYSPGADKVIVEAKIEKDRVLVSVEDFGLGISEKEIPQIFTRFFRADKTRKIEGLGLGLYLCKQIIEAHKGETWVESQEGKGSKFFFSLPILGEKE